MIHYHNVFLKGSLLGGINMSKHYGKTIVIHDDTLIGRFSTDGCENCTFVFQNCTLLNFEFCSRRNSIEFINGNRLCESVVLDAAKVVIKEFVGTENLESLSINGGYFRMPEGMNMRASGDISIISDIQSFSKNRIESLSALTLQSSTGTTVYRNCSFIGRYGVKISALKGNLRIEHSEIEVTDSRVKTFEEDHLNGIYLSCYGIGTRMHLLGNVIKTDVLEVTHPNYMVVTNTELDKAGEYGRFLSRNQERNGQIISHSYIEEQTLLDQFYSKIEAEKENKSKILELIGIAFKKSA